MKTFLRFWIVAVVLLSLATPLQAQQRTIMQDAAVANGNGLTLNTNIQGTAIFGILCAGCSGGTTINFEGTVDGTNYAAMQATILSGASSATGTTATGIWSASVAGLLNVRTRISAYSAGTVTVVGTAVPIGGGASSSGGTIGTITGTVGIDQITADANKVVCTSGCSGGTSDADDGTVAGGQTTGLAISLNQVYDGSNWKRETIGTAGTASAQVTTVQGIASMTPLLVGDGTGAFNVIVDSSGLPTGASTSAKQPALGTAGTASTDVISIQGIASMTPLLVNPGTAALFGVYVEDAAETAGGNLNMAGAVVRTDCLVGSTSTAGDNATFNISQGGLLCTTSTGFDTILDITPGTGATKLGKAEDAAAASGDVGVAMLGVIQATLTAPAADGDYTVPKLTSTGATWVTSTAVDVAEGAAVATNPVPIGVVYRTSFTALDAGDIGYLLSDVNGRAIVAPAPGPLVSGAITSAMTGTTSTSLVGATASNYLYITQCTVSNTDADTDTEMILQDGSGGTTLFTIPAPHLTSGAVVPFPTPLKVPTAGNALFVANVTTGATTKVSCAGWRSTASF